MAAGFRDVAERTLERMARGGVYDQIGGGFHRYSVDERWCVPHFEKMSYDNSELLKNFLHGYQVTGNSLFRETAEGIILNAGALTHTSVAVLDALFAAGLPVIEVHLSNIFRRESFRHHSYVSLAANGVICGLGAKGYELAVDAIASLIEGESGEAA